MIKQLLPFIKSTLLLSFVLSNLVGLLGQDGRVTIPFHELAQKQGLNDLFTAFVSQNSEGYIWIGSYENGLYRYDGRNFKNFRANPTDSSAISHNQITSRCFEDKAGNLWFSTYNGINCYLRKKGIFRFYPIPDSLHSDAGVKDFYCAFHLDQQDQLWLRVLENEQGFLYTLNTQTGEVAYRHPIKGQRFSVSSDADGRVRKVVASMFLPNPGARVYQYNADGALIANKSLLAEQDDPTTYQTFITANQTIWLGTSEGLARVQDWDSANPELDFFPDFKEESIGVAWSIVPYKEDQLLVSTSKLGLLLFDAQENQFIRRLGGGQDNPFAIDSPALQELFLDEDQVLWVSSYGRGLFAGSLEKAKFSRLGIGPYSSAALASAYLAEDQKERVWGVSANEAVFFINSQENSIVFPRFNQEILGKIDGPTAIFPGSQGQVWLCKGRELFRIVEEKPELVYSFEEMIDYLFELKSGRILVSTSGKSYELSPDGSSYSRKNLKVSNVTADPWFSAAAQDASGRIYLSLNHTKISVFEEDQDSIRFVKDIEGPTRFWGTYEEPTTKFLWMTTPIGVGRVDQTSLTFEMVVNQEGLGTTWGVLSHGDGKMWLSNGDGLHQYATETHELTSFQPEDGSFATGYFRHSALRRANGKMWFGGPEGITVFHPDSVEFITTSPQVHLTNLKVNGKPFQTQDSTLISQSSSFVLAPGQNYLELEFIGLEYSHPQAIKYKYFLENYDQQWTESGTYNKASYQKLPPGDYIFKVQATNSDGVWSDVHEVPLTILPYFYQTLWFKVLMIFLGAVLLFFLYRDQLARRLRAAEIKNLEELDAFKSRFFTSITHEFRSPLTIILSYLQTALDKNKNLKRGNLEIMQRSGQQLLHLVNQILDLRKLEDSRVALQETVIDVAQLGEETVIEFQDLAFGKGIHLSFSTSTQTFLQSVDREKLRKILSNLISNAIKFTQQGGKVDVSLTLEDEQYRLAVADTGIGIPASKLSKVFDQFYQAHDGANHKFGSGVGLALSKELAIAMGGDIEVTSKEGKGSTFSLVLPKGEIAGPPLSSPKEDEEITILPSLDMLPEAGEVSPDTEALALELTAEAEAGKAGLPLILVAEDNPEMQQLILSSLIPDFRVVIRGNGQAGWEAAQELIPDLIISDLKMPHMDGYEFTKAVKAHPTTSHIPVILLTGLDDIDARLKGIQEGADIYLNKPFYEDELLSWINNLLRIRARLKGIYQQFGGQAMEEKLDETERTLTAETEFVRKVLGTIAEHYHDDTFTVEELSGLLGMEYMKFWRKWSALHNETVPSIIQEMRITKAKELLLSKPQEKIGEIGRTVGFSDPSYFTKVFKKVVGCSPKQYRERFKK